VAAGCYYWLMHEPSVEQSSPQHEPQPTQERALGTQRPPLDDEAEAPEDSEAVLQGSSRAE
jgi:hypothetical protein